MTENVKIALIISSVGIGAIATTQIVKGINASNGNISQGINYALRSTGDAIATDIKAIGIGLGIGAIGALLLPPPFNIAALIIGGAVAVALAVIPHSQGTVTVTDNGSGGAAIGDGVGDTYGGS